MNIKSYAVIRDNTVLRILRTREMARVVKADLGGKENGVSIIQMTAVGEVRWSLKLYTLMVVLVL